MKWEAPEGVEVKHHFHYVSGGGVIIVETQEPTALYETLEPFKPLVEFDVEPVINYLEAMAISTDVDEWAASVSASSHGNGGRARPPPGRKRHSSSGTYYWTASRPSVSSSGLARCWR